MDLTNYSLRFEVENGDVEIIDAANGKRLVKIPSAAVGDLLNVVNDGLCPECGSDINVGQVICGYCLDRAVAYREQHG